MHKSLRQSSTTMCRPKFRVSDPPAEVQQNLCGSVEQMRQSAHHRTHAQWPCVASAVLQVSACERYSESKKERLLHCCNRAWMKKWWVNSMECYCYLRHVQDLLADGKIPYEKRFGEPFKGPVVPIFGVTYSLGIFCVRASAFVDVSFEL